MGSVYQRASDGRWVAASSKGPRGARLTTVKYADTEDQARALLLTMEPPPPTASERFWAKVNRGDGCWEWQGVRVRGYGMAWDGERRVLAHRFAYQDVVGPIPVGRYVCHTCDNPPCVRPDHLFAGDQTDNMRDMLSKGRAAHQKSAGTTL